MSLIDETNEALVQRIEALCVELLGGRRHGKEWIAARTEDGGPGDSLTVRLFSPKRGSWYWFAKGIGGDPLGLIAELRTNGDMGRALTWARDFLGEVRQETAETKRQGMIARMAAETAEQRRREANEARARGLFFDAQADLAATPAYEYLNRRLRFGLSRLAPLPVCLRYERQLYHAELESWELPGLVAAIVDVTGRLVGVHRTWLVKRADGWDRLRESDGNDRDGLPLVGKKVLGSAKGATIRLWPSGRYAGWRRVAPGSAITLTEGIETALTVALIAPSTRVASAVSVSGFANVVLPPQFTTVTLCVDGDGENAATQAAVARAEAAHREQRVVRVLYPPCGADDWNTALMTADGGQRERAGATTAG